MQHGHGHITRSHLPVSKIRQLFVAKIGPATRAEIDAQVGGMVGQIERIAPATVPNGLEHLVGARLALANAIDEFFARRLAPAIDGVLGARLVIGAVQMLQRRDIARHRRLCIAEFLVAIAIGNRLALIGAIAHHRPRHGIHRRCNFDGSGERCGRALAVQGAGAAGAEPAIWRPAGLLGRGFMGVAQSQGMADFMHDGEVGIVALLGCGQIFRAEPDITTLCHC